MSFTDPNWYSQVLSDLHLIMPEVWLVVAMCAVLMVPFLARRNVVALTTVAILGLLSAMGGAMLGQGAGESFRTVFSGMLVVDPFSQFFKLLLMLFTLMVVVQWCLLGRDKTLVGDVPDFLCLLLGATFGMSLMASANNLLMILIATETASFPSFALAGFRKYKATATEGSLKYVLFGAVSSALMIYGMSLVYGSCGSLDLATIGQHLSTHGTSPLMAIGLLGMFAGFAFKLSAVPLHFWCPDVFEGATFEVTTFLSVASKAAALCMLVRVLYNFGFTHMTQVSSGLGVGLGILGAVTATWGNLLALHQIKIKRLLAYSSISHAGYMIMGASLILAGNPGTLAAALLFYILVYMFMNMGAFTVAGWIASCTGHEDIRQYAGLFKRAPILSGLMIFFLLSLFGMPGLGGFMGKLFLGTAMANAGGLGFTLLAVLLINTLISLWYYLRPAYFMVFSKVENPQTSPLPQPRLAMVSLLGVCVAMILWTGLLPNLPIKSVQTYGVLIVKVPPRTISHSEDDVAQRDAAAPHLIAGKTMPPLSLHVPQASAVSTDIHETLVFSR